ncbi:metal ABC transporter substrate-binding protein [Thauera mechernichensis]|uniref:Metal ABC transporter substrate-binding protein n=1 Tax=Thauera mechernichensis TaxID=82788 RepID=A0ABW3W7Z9_9RHOO|nr:MULTISPECIES: metal ABC transporter substrate-binding protein [Thauera]ENO82681.1 periplasmic solute binding protein [Thauera sp. 27]MDG3063655.1 metal ABC transporter substrate-binding protein [Thauera mechernichensis]
MKAFLAAVAVAFGIALAPSAALAEAPRLLVVATTPSMGVIARTVGGDRVDVQVLVAPDRDAHTLNARPSMIAHLRRADLVLAVGAQLEEGWLPAALDAAANPRLRKGQPGYFAAAEPLHLRPTRFDPALGGHVHGEGNPHLNLSPPRMITVAHAFADRLAALAPESAPAFEAAAAAFEDALRSRLPALRARFGAPLRLVAHHEEFDYFAEWLPVELVGFVEEKPGVPPGPAHLARLIEQQRGQAGTIVLANYQPQAPARRVADELGWPLHALALEPATADAESYFALIEHWVDSLAQ